jgi:hypothetical protein
MAFYLLFTGHMTDKPDRPRPRFPADHESKVRDRTSSAISSFVSDCADARALPKRHRDSELCEFLFPDNPAIPSGGSIETNYAAYAHVSLATTRHNFRIDRQQH